MDKDVDDEKPPLRLAFSNTDRIRFRIPIRSALGRNPACVMMDGEEDDDDGDQQERGRVNHRLRGLGVLALESEVEDMETEVPLRVNAAVTA